MTNPYPSFAASGIVGFSSSSNFSNGRLQLSQQSILLSFPRLAVVHIVNSKPDKDVRDHYRDINIKI
jgi:hypothetical protein